jgi:Putative zincin peptidase
MNIATRNEPIYVFRLTPKISLIWTALGSLLLILAVAGASWYYATIHKQTVIFSVEASEGGAWQGILAFVVLLAITFGTTVIHELVHGITFAAFGGSPRYGLKVKYFLPLVYATSPGDLFHRNAFIVIALAPLIVIDIICLLLLAIFPQAFWLIWVIAFNTGGAIGDIWIAVQLLRCSKSVRVEDREEGIAIYAPSNVTCRELPFAITDKSRPRSGIKALLNLAFMALALVLISSFLLIPVLKTLEVPSFIIGNNYFWIFRWINNTKGFSIEFNWISFVIVIFTLLLLSFLTNMVRRRDI